MMHLHHGVFLHILSLLMGLIEDYKDILAQYKKYSAELPAISREIEIHTKNITRLNNELHTLDDESQNITNTRIQQELQELMRVKRDSYAAEIQGVQEQLSRLTSSYKASCQNIRNNTYDSKFSSTNELIKQIEAGLSSTNLPTSLPPELQANVSSSLAGSKNKYTKSQILQLINEVKTNKYNPVRRSESSQFVKSIADLFSLKAVRESSWSNKTKVLIYLLYLICCTLCIIYLPVVAIGVMDIFLFSSYKIALRDNSALVKLALPVSKLRDAYAQKTEQLKQQIQKLQKSDLAAEEEKYLADRQPLSDKISELQYDLMNVEETVRSSFSDKELRESISAQFEAQRKEINDKLTHEQRKLDVATKQLTANKRKIEIFENNRKELLPKIKEAYLSPTKPGTSPYLIKSFLISINEQTGALDEFNYNGRSTFIMYKGENSSSNKPLITMMLMQFMASMTLASLEIYLTDIQSAGMDYAPFNSCVNITSDIGEIKKLLGTINDELITRRDSIAAVEDNIELFNRKRLENHGIATPYILLFLQDITISEMTDDKLIQLVANGPRVGIIPIIFINQLYLVGLNELQPDKLNQLTKFFSAFQYSSKNKTIFNTFVFEGKTENLMRNPKITDAVLNKVRKRG